MAQKYGGKFSPDGAPDTARKSVNPTDSFRDKRASKVGFRANLLFLVPLPFAWQAFTSQPVVMAQYLMALALLLLSAWLTREGLIAEDAYDARTVARRPAFPRKMAGSLFSGIGLFAAGLAGHGVLEGAIFGAIGLILHSFAFGIDPMKDKGIEGIDIHQTDRVARAVEGAEEHLSAMKDAILRSGDRNLERRVDGFATTARDLFRTVEQDPRDLSAARKYMSVYLKGARDATAKFADVYARSQDVGARANYEALLDDLEQNFAARTERLLQNDQDGLSVEIDVLRERLQREGVARDV